jgi:predicted nucleotide-binding protein
MANPNDLPDPLRGAVLPPGLASENSDALVRALAGYGTPKSTPTTVPTEPVVSKLAQTLAQGRLLLENKRATKESYCQWVRRVRSSATGVFGKDATIVKSLNLLEREVVKSPFVLDDFARFLTGVEALICFMRSVAESGFPPSSSRASVPPVTKSVFVIHGRDELNTRRLQQLLQGEFGLNPIVMLAKPGMSRPLTDKFEDEAQRCSFAFALFTRDDEVANGSLSYMQARPNVVYETGWFVGRLGRQRVALLLQEDVRIHSDLDGVSQIRFKDNIEEKFLEIRKELNAAGVID